jgi:hypothetical protein
MAGAHELGAKDEGKKEAGRDNEGKNGPGLDVSLAVGLLVFVAHGEKVKGKGGKVKGGRQWDL